MSKEFRDLAHKTLAIRHVSRNIEIKYIFHFKTFFMYLTLDNKDTKDYPENKLYTILKFDF